MCCHQLWCHIIASRMVGSGSSRTQHGMQQGHASWDDLGVCWRPGSGHISWAYVSQRYMTSIISGHIRQMLHPPMGAYCEAESAS
jgi:hypothetical protein